MKKSNVIAVLTVAVMVAVLFGATAAFGSSCSSTCGSKSAGTAKTEGSQGCMGDVKKSASYTHGDDHGFLTSYFEIRHVLALDEVEDLSGLSKDLVADTKEFRKALDKKDVSAGQLEALKEIEKAASDMTAGTASASKAKRLEAARQGFRTLSHKVLAYVKEYGWSGAAYSFYCPMAKDSWLQETDKAGNPYYGAEMFKCGKMTGHVMEGKYMAAKDEAAKMDSEPKKMVKNQHGHH